VAGGDEESELKYEAKAANGWLTLDGLEPRTRNKLQTKTKQKSKQNANNDKKQQQIHKPH